MKKFSFLLTASVVAMISFSACSDDDPIEGGKPGGSGNDSTTVVDPIVLTYDKFLNKDDVTITSPDTATISVSKDYLLANNIDIKVDKEPVPMVVWRTMNTVPFVRKVVKSEIKGDKVELTTVYGDMGDVFPESDINLDTDLHINTNQKHTRVTRAGNEVVNPDRYKDEEGNYHPAVYIVHEGLSTVNDTVPQVMSRTDEAQCFTAEDLYADNADFRILNIDQDIKNLEVPLVNKGNTKIKLYAKNNHVKAIAGLRVNINTRWFKLKKFECVAYGNFAARTTLGINATTEYQKDLNKHLATFGKCTAVFWVGIIPVAVTSEVGLRAVGDFQFNASCDVSTSLDYYANYEAGAVYEGRWYSINKGSAGSNNKLNVKTEAEMSAKANIGAMMYANVKLYGCAGPEINLGPKVSASASTRLKSEVVGNNSRNYLEGKYNIGISVGGSIDAVISIWKWELARWSAPFTIWNGPSKQDSFRIDF